MFVVILADRHTDRQTDKHTQAKN